MTTAQDSCVFFFQGWKTLHQTLLHCKKRKPHTGKLLTGGKTSYQGPMLLYKVIMSAGCHYGTIIESRRPNFILDQVILTLCEQIFSPLRGTITGELTLMTARSFCNYAKMALNLLRVITQHE